MQSYSQVHNTTIQGRVSSSEHHLDGVHIYNMSTGFGTVSNDLGLFEIEAKVNDTLLFSSLQYKNRNITINRNHINNKFIVVQMETQVTELEEMTLHQLSGSMTTDLQKVPKVAPKKYIFEWDKSDLAKEFEEDRIDRLKPPDAQLLANPIVMLGGGAAATFPLFALEAEYKLRRELKEKKDFRTTVIKKLGNRFFINNLNIKEDLIYEFLDFCESTEALSYFRRGDLLSLIKLFKEKSIAYHERKKD